MITKKIKKEFNFLKIGIKHKKKYIKNNKKVFNSNNNKKIFNSLCLVKHKNKIFLNKKLNQAIFFSVIKKKI